MKTDRTIYQSIIGPALATVGLLLIPLLAMQFTSEVDWTLSDFVVAGILLFGTGFTYKLLTRKSIKLAYRVAIGFALLTGLFLVWVNLAVGVMGSEDNPANLMYFGVIAVGIIGAVMARFQSRGMVHVMGTMALAQALVAGIALIAGVQESSVSSVLEILGVNGFFVALFAVSALLFHYAEQEGSQANVDTEG